MTVFAVCFYFCLQLSDRILNLNIKTTRWPSVRFLSSVSVTSWFRCSPPWTFKNIDIKDVMYLLWEHVLCVRGFYSVLNYECYNQLSVRQRPAAVLQALDAAAVLAAVRRGRSGDWMSSRRVRVAPPAEDQPVQARRHTHITLLYELLELYDQRNVWNHKLCCLKWKCKYIYLFITYFIFNYILFTYITNK